jgi:hypothetical protein
LDFCHGQGVKNKPAQSAIGWNLTEWFSVTGTGLAAVNGKMLNKLSCLILHHATSVDTGHGYYALDAGRE